MLLLVQFIFLHQTIFWSCFSKMLKCYQSFKPLKGYFLFLSLQFYFIY